MKKCLFIIFIFITLLGLSFLIFNFQSFHQYEKLKVIKVIDGDTIILSNGEKIRIIGIDCPELNKSQKNWVIEFIKETLNISEINLSCLNYYGYVCYLYTKNKLLGKEVKIKRIKKDKYGRTLAYIYYNNSDFGKSLIENGCAIVYPFEDFKKKKEYYETMFKAINHSNGLWSCIIS